MLKNNFVKTWMLLCREYQEIKKPNIRGDLNESRQVLCIVLKTKKG